MIIKLMMTFDQQGIMIKHDNYFWFSEFQTTHK